MLLRNSRENVGWEDHCWRLKQVMSPSTVTGPIDSYLRHGRSCCVICFIVASYPNVAGRRAEVDGTRKVTMELPPNGLDYRVCEVHVLNRIERKPWSWKNCSLLGDAVKSCAVLLCGQFWNKSGRWIATEWDGKVYNRQVEHKRWRGKDRVKVPNGKRAKKHTKETGHPTRMGARPQNGKPGSGVICNKLFLLDH